jgi:hypothetical protein
MKRGGKILGGVAMVAIAACSNQATLQIRSTPAPLSAVDKPVPLRIAEARAQFALGNVALALESFRKAWREDPTSIDALHGIASCYDRMARFDLSRRHYEMALALAPGDTRLLGAFAASLELQGKSSEAEGVRREIAVRLAAREAPVAPPTAAPAQVPSPVRIARPADTAPEPVQVAQAGAIAAVAARTEIVVPAIRPQPAQAAAPRAPATPPHVPASAVKPVSVPVPPPADLPVQVADAAPVTVAVRTEMHLQPLAEPEVGRTVTVKLPPPRPAPVQLAQAPAAPEVLAPPKPEPAPEAVEAREYAARPEDESGPRIERLSPAVVALITTDGPRWKAQTVARTERSETVRFVPLREANARSRVRLLNAARVNRLAARTRNWLVAHGWSRMPIGDSPAVRTRSVIHYPPGQRALAQSLGNQFGFAIEERSDAKFVTMLLGSDAARIEELQPQSA